MEEVEDESGDFFPLRGAASSSYFFFLLFHLFLSLSSTLLLFPRTLMQPYAIIVRLFVSPFFLTSTIFVICWFHLERSVHLQMRKERRRKVSSMLLRRGN